MFHRDPNVCIGTRSRRAPSRADIDPTMISLRAVPERHKKKAKHYVIAFSLFVSTMLVLNFDDMQSRNPSIKSILGVQRQAPASLLAFTPPSKSGLQFEPMVPSVRSERELRWLEASRPAFLEALLWCG